MSEIPPEIMEAHQIVLERIASNEEAAAASIPEPMSTSEETESCLCDECMAGFTARIFLMRGKEVFRSKYCPECVAKEEARQALLVDAGRPKTREERWAVLCPKTYLRTEVARLRSEGKLKPYKPKVTSAEFVDMILARPLDERGIGLTGDSRLGKTRLLFALLRKYYLQGHSIRYTYAPDFSDEYAALMGESADKGNRYLERCIETPVWFLDDLGKGRLSESAQRALLRVVEKRTNSELPIFTTCNHDGDTLEKLMAYDDGRPSEYAHPMIERLREFCDFYQF